MNAKRVFLTGASAGIGRAIADRLTQDGHQVWGTSRDASRLPTHDNLHRLELDLCDASAIRACVRHALEEAGSFDVLINNAGRGVYSPLEHLSRERMASQFELLVFAPMELVRLLLPGMRDIGRGLIVNVSSLACVFPIPYMGAYSACKAALSSLSWALDMELCNEPIRVIDLRPGDTRTDFHRHMERHPSLECADADDNITRAHRAYTERMECAPSPEHVARLVSDLLAGERKTPSQVNVGSVFQTRIAPFLSDLSPRTWTRSVLARYYRLKCRR